MTQMLTVASRRFTRLLRSLPPELLLWALWLGLIAGLEVHGRRSSMDLADAWGVCAVLLLGAFTWRCHVHRPLRVVTFAAERCRRLLQRAARWRLLAGIDFRESPPLPRGFPRRLQALLAGAWGAVALLFLARGFFPGSARDVVQAASGALTILVLTVLWSLLALAALAMLALTLILLHLAFRHLALPSRLRSILETSTACFYGGALFAAATLLPGWVAPLGIVAYVALQVLLAALPRHPSLLVLWRPRAAPEGGRVTQWAWWGLWQESLLAACWIALILVSRGDTLRSTPSSSAPVTAALGLVFSWIALGLYPVAGLLHVLFCFNGWFRNPARPVPTCVHVAGVSRGRARGRLRRSLLAAGFDVVFDGRRRKHRVEVRASEQPEESPGWPLSVPVASLLRPEVQHRLRRRDEIQRRRRLFRGLERIFRAAAARKFRRGVGFWLAPHYWFVEGLSRDKEEDERVTNVVGPPFHHVIPLPARSHLHEVLRSCGIDLIFVEDGVSYRRLRRVLGLVFEVFDIHGGRQNVEERHFVGLPGIRVVVHEVTLNDPFRSRTFPEPEYEDIGRARVLHVFRDRGEHPELDPVPAEFDSIPFRPRHLLPL